MQADRVGCCVARRSRVTLEEVGSGGAVRRCCRYRKPHEGVDSSINVNMPGLRCPWRGQKLRPLLRIGRRYFFFTERDQWGRWKVCKELLAATRNYWTYRWWPSDSNNCQECSSPEARERADQVPRRSGLAVARSCRCMERSFVIGRGCNEGIRRGNGGEEPSAAARRRASITIGRGG